MELLITNQYAAEKHQPDKPTYAIRIFSSWHDKDDRGQLKESEFYSHIAEYVFDDCDEYYEAGPVYIDEKIAKQIIDDFANNRYGIECLLVHCSLGRNRSPAVAVALNEIFELGNNTEELKQKYNRFNKYVYKIIKESAKKYSTS
ncbi:hypothetical protein KY312_00485 [Candidatus Woesearchaeota archaeon]|nr:hypothetical protein [Candidatus Woesearchaeota archaeon]